MYNNFKKSNKQFEINLVIAAVEKKLLIVNGLTKNVKY